MQIENFSTTSLQSVIPSYLYNEYSDDSDLQAFIESFNAMSQGYLDWFNDTPLALYTSQNVNGALLDWISMGIYGISRPTIFTGSRKLSGAFLTKPFGFVAFSHLNNLSSGTSVIASDDIYKRVLTWDLYSGDGKQMTMQWLRRRIARFLFGSNGADLNPLLISSNLAKVSLTCSTSGSGSMLVQKGSLSTVGFSVLGIDQLKNTSHTLTGTTHIITITIANNSIGQVFSQLLNGGFLALPFQITFRVVLV